MELREIRPRPEEPAQDFVVSGKPMRGWWISLEPGGRWNESERAVAAVTAPGLWAAGEIRSPCTSTGPPGGSGGDEHSEYYTPTSYENDLDGGKYESDLEAEEVLRERELEDEREEWSFGFSIDSDDHLPEHQRSQN